MKLPWHVLTAMALTTSLAHAAGPVQLGTGIPSGGIGTNNREDTVGQYAIPGRQSAFLRLADGQIIDLSPPGMGGVAHGINDRRQVVGATQTPEHAFVAFLWSFKEGLTTLGTLPNDTVSGASTITESGIVVGSSCCSFGAPHAFIWSAGEGMRDLGTLVGSGATCESGSSASSVNVRQMVVGVSCSSSGVLGGDHAFLWTPKSGMIDLGTLGGYRSGANTINDAGVVAGTSFIPDGHPHAFMWSRQIGMEDLGTLGGGSSEANGINNRGAVTGSSTLRDGTTHAFVWTPERGMEDLGALPGGTESTGFSINNRGDVVGTSLDASGNPLAVYWPAAGAARK